MKLYYAPGACSLADHIPLDEAGLTFEYERVDLKTTASGADFTGINPKGHVPALVLDSGKTIAENVAVLDWIGAQSPSVSLSEPLGRTCLLEALAYISSEVHKSFHPFFTGGTEAEKAGGQAMLQRRLQLLAGQMRGDYLFGGRPTIADYSLFVMLLWTAKFDIAIARPLIALRERILARPVVQATMSAEAWPYPASAAPSAPTKQSRSA